MLICGELQFCGTKIIYPEIKSSVREMGNVIQQWCQASKLCGMHYYLQKKAIKTTTTTKKKNTEVLFEVLELAGSMFTHMNRF